MSKISQLLEVQGLDLAGDQLRKRRNTLPEHDALRESQARAVSVDAAHATLLEHREALARSERDQAGEVEAMAARAQEVEDTLYSGTVKVAKELATIQEEGRLLRVRQSTLEESQMELLEEIDQLDGEIADNRAKRQATETECEETQQIILRLEGEIDAELGKIADQRPGVTDGIPTPVLAEYDRLRTKERLAGRAAASMTDGGCGGCRMRLPVIEYNRMKAEPEDALIACTHCGRVLVR